MTNLPTHDSRTPGPRLRRLVHWVDSVAFGDSTRYESGRLFVSADHARGILAAPVFSDIRVSLAGPGMSVRIVKVLDAVEPRAKAEGGMYPGWLGPADGEDGTGWGETHVLRGAAILGAGYLPRAQEGLVDMSGPGSQLSPFGGTHNVVIEFQPAPEASWEDVEAALRVGILKLSVALAQAAMGSAPDEVEDLEAPQSEQHPDLRRVGLITNLQTQGAFKDVFVFGRSFGESSPCAVDPAELEDGAVVSGQYGHPALKNPTYMFQNHPLTTALRKRHGKDLMFAGMILCPEPVGQDRKEAVSAQAVSLCKEFGWDGFIVTKEGGGNADSDMALKMDAAQDGGIASVGLFAEMSGPGGDGPPVVGPPVKATAMVSTGNYDERIWLPEMETALGGDRLDVAGAVATAAVEIPTAVIFGSLSPLGWGRLTAADIPGDQPGSASPGVQQQAGGPEGDGRPPGGARTVVHYVNQFFAGIGGEDEAGRPPGKLDGLAPISRKLQSLLGEDLSVAATVFCGDDYAASKAEAAGEIMALVKEAGAEMVVAGPAFTSGRYGIACARVVSAASSAGIQAVCGMHQENPGLTELSSGGEPVPVAIATGATAREMTPALQSVSQAAIKLAAGKKLGESDGLIEKPVRRNRLAGRNAAERAVDLVLARLQGDSEATEIPFSEFGAVSPAPPLADPSAAVVALLSEGGMVPAGNPGRLESARATKWLRYSLDGKDRLEQGEFQSVHGGFSPVAANADPNRILPLDAAREMEKQGRIGKLFGEFFVTVGNGTSVASANRFGVEWAAELRRAGVQAAILTST